MDTEKVARKRIRGKPPNEHWEVAPSVTCIKLTQGKYALIDTEDWPLIAKYKWFAIRAKNTFYVGASIYKPDGKQRTIQLHRLLLDAPDDREVDHDDGNGLNNQRSNISIVTVRENGQNRHHAKTSKYPGVSWNKRLEKWIAQISVNGTRTHLGCFTDEESAYAAYQKACDDIAAGIPVLPKRIRRCYS